MLYTKEVIKANSHSLSSSVSERVVDDLGFEVQGISGSMSDDEWNNALTSHGIWLKMAAEDAADKLYNEHAR